MPPPPPSLTPTPQFNGGVVVVTHDARLIETCECQLWVVEKQGVTPWVEGFEDYKESLLIAMEKQMAEEQAAREKKLREAQKAKEEKLEAMKKKKAAAAKA
jgi:ATP-binding cassette subfamily F protein 1